MTEKQISVQPIDRIFLDIHEINKKVRLPLGSLFVGRTKNSYLIGPIVNKNFCISCFRLRLLSSSYCDFEEYLKITNKDFFIINDVLKKIGRPEKKIMLEIEKSGRIKKHFLICVPGCKKHYEE